MKTRPPSRSFAFHFAAAASLLACTLATGCKSPWGWWGGGDGASNLYGSSAPDVGAQKYQGLSQDFSGGAASAYKPPAAASENYFTSAWNKSTFAVGNAFSWQSKPTETDDPTSLNSKTKPVTPDVYIAAGRMYETQGKFTEAQQQYEKALKAAPNDLASLISIARLHDRQGQFPKAIEAYQRAAKAHPRSGLVQNDLGLCYARQKDANNAIAALTRACEFSPKNPKYRNNLATVFVESGRTEEAYRQLKVLNSEGVAHYNLAYMLSAKGKTAEATQHLQMALQAEPGLHAASELLAQLTGQPVAPPGVSQQPAVQMAMNPNVQPPMDERQQALSMFQAGPPQRTAPPTGTNPFQPASQSSSGPVEIIFPTAPANSQGVPAQPAVQPAAAPPAVYMPPAAPEAPAPAAPAATDDGSFRIGDEEGPQLLPPVAE